MYSITSTITITKIKNHYFYNTRREKNLELRRSTAQTNQEEVRKITNQDDIDISQEHPIIYLWVLHRRETNVSMQVTQRLAENITMLFDLKKWSTRFLSVM